MLPDGSFKIPDDYKFDSEPVTLENLKPNYQLKSGEQDHQLFLSTDFAEYLKEYPLLRFEAQVDANSINASDVELW